MEKIGKKLNTLFNIDEGLVTGFNKVDKTVIEKLSPAEIEKYSIRIGDGVFILNKNEVDSLGLSKKELDLVKPFYTSSAIHRYWINDEHMEYALYLTRETEENSIPNIILHLAGENANEKFKPRLDSRRECKEVLSTSRK